MNELSEEQLMRALRRAGDGEVVDGERRASIRNEVLSEYDRYRTTEWSLEPVALDVVEGDATQRGRWPGRWLMVTAAGVAALVAGLGFIVTNSNSDTTGTADRPTEPTPLPVATAPAEPGAASTADLELGAVVPEGRYVLDGPTEVSFVIPDGLRLDAASDGSIRLALTDGNATITVSSVADLAALDDALDQAALDGTIRIERTAGNLGGRSYIRRDVIVTAQANAAGSCGPTGVCDVLGAADPAFATLTLMSGSENYLSPIPLDGGAGVVVLEQFSSSGSPTGDAATAIISSIE